LGHRAFGVGELHARTLELGGRQLHDFGRARGALDGLAADGHLFSGRGGARAAGEDRRREEHGGAEKQTDSWRDSVRGFETGLLLTTTVRIARAA
jgi:hypothetical protein